MTQSKALQFVALMISEKRNTDWLYAELKRAQVTLDDIVLGLKDSSEGNYSYDVRDAMLWLGEREINHWYNTAPRNKQVVLKMVLSKAQIVVSDMEPIGETKGRLLGLAAQGIMSIADDYSDPGAAYRYADKHFQLAMACGLKRGTELWGQVLYLSGVCAIHCAEYDIGAEKKKRYVYALGCFSNCRDEGVKSGHPYWESSLKNEAVAISILRELN